MLYHIFVYDTEICNKMFIMDLIDRKGNIVVLMSDMENLQKVSLMKSFDDSGSY